ncbi:Arginase, catabolizes arginine to ornithine and urea [Vanrija albida]|uniref:Arginase n=1 Tax=Vanrija albida TaxID=181172 RepID=A0ABR3PZP1_9TREE
MSALRATALRSLSGRAIAPRLARAHSSRSEYFLRPLTETAPSPTYEYKFLEQPATVSVLSYPFSGGQPRAGVDKGPDHLVEAGLLKQLQSLGWHVEYSEGAVDQLLATVKSDADIGKMKQPRAVSAVTKQLAADVAAVAQGGKLPLTLGGDHSLAVGTVAGTKRKFPDAALVWVDAHADINTPLTTDSGNLHGCPVSFLLGLEGTDVAPFNEWLKPCLKPEDLVYIGLRDIDNGEKKILKDLGVKVFTMHDVDKHGIGKVMDLVLDHIGRDRPIHLSYDVDALDPTITPSTGTPVRGGLNFREGHYIAEAIAETGNLVALDVVEVNPSLGEDAASVAQTVAIGCSLSRAALGETLL